MKVAVHNCRFLPKSHMSVQHYNSWIQTKDEITTFVRWVEDYQKVQLALDGNDALWVDDLPVTLSHYVEMTAIPSLVASKPCNVVKEGGEKPAKLNDLVWW